MGEGSQFIEGQQAPNNGIYMEIGETGSMVQKPKFVKLSKGDRFPENTNDDRKWILKPKPKEFG